MAISALMVIKTKFVPCLIKDQRISSWKTLNFLFITPAERVISSWKLNLFVYKIKSREKAKTNTLKTCKKTQRLQFTSTFGSATPNLVLSLASHAEASAILAMHRENSLNRTRNKQITRRLRAMLVWSEEFVNSARFECLENMVISQLA